MRKFYLLALLSIITTAYTGCGVSTAGSSQNDSPTAAYKNLYSAVKSKDTDAIRAQLSKGSLGLAEMASQKNNKPIEEVLANGFTATTFADSIPEMRDERIKDGFGALEVWNARDKRWEDLPFVLEDGSWKLAFGDAFAGSYKLPEKGLAVKEAEAANVMNSNSVVPLNPNINGNFRSGPRRESDIKKRSEK